MSSDFLRNSAPSRRPHQWRAFYLDKLSKRRILLAQLVIAATAAAGCGGSSPGSTSAASTSPSSARVESTVVNTAYQPGGTPQQGGTLTYDRNLADVSFTPWLGTQNGDIFAIQQVFNELVEDAPQSPEPQPALAESWTISPSRLIYTFKLRPGVRFSNGEPLTAEDVKFSLDGFFSPKVDPNWAGIVTEVKSVTIPDPSHVRVTLSQPRTSFLYDLTISGAAIVPRRLVQREGATAFGLHPVGTGPFMVATFSPGNPRVVLRRNPYYWRKGLPYLDQVVFNYVPNDTTRMLDAESGSADIADSVPVSQVSQVGGSPGVTVVRQNYDDGDWIFVNGTKGPLSQVRVRQALVYATPLTAIARVVFHGEAEVAATANLQTKYWDPSIRPYPYDLARARALLAQAGLPHGFTATMLIFSGDEVGKQIATILQASWGQVGVHLAVQQEDSGSVLTALSKENYQLINEPPQAVSSDVTVDDEFALEFGSVHSIVENFWTGWHDAQASAIVTRAVSISNEPERRRLFDEYQHILYVQQPIIGIAYPPNLFAIRSSVHNFVTTDIGWPLLQQVWLSH